VPSRQRKHDLLRGLRLGPFRGPDRTHSGRIQSTVNHPNSDLAGHVVAVRNMVALSRGDCKGGTETLRQGRPARHERREGFPERPTRVASPR